MPRGSLTYVPYEGNEPYLELAFAYADRRVANRLLTELAARGVRVWYAEQNDSGGTSLASQQARSNAARLLVLLVSDAAQADRKLKAAALYQQSQGKPLICIDLDKASTGLAMGLSPEHPHLAAHTMHGDMHQVAETLIRTDGFSYDLIGEPAAPQDHTRRTRTLVLAALACLALALSLIGMRFGWFVDTSLHANDTLELESPALILAAREALDGAAITPESAATIHTLHLTALPDDLAELDNFSSLERLEVPLDEAERASELLPTPYDIVLVG